MNQTQISATGKSASEQFILSFNGTGPGTFQFDDNNMGSVALTNYTFSSMFTDTPVGQIVISKYDVTNKKISGTFTFKGADLDGNIYSVTEGKFDNVQLAIQ